MQLESVANLEEMKLLLDSDEYSFRFDIGLSQPSASLKFSDREMLVKSFATHFAVLSVKAELDQLVEGLKTFDVPNTKAIRL